MNRLSVIVMVLVGLWAPSHAQVFREALFGLDIPVQRWDMQTDIDYFAAPYYGRLGLPTDAANIRFATETDTTDIILIVDKGRSRIHWLRCNAGPAPRSLEHLGCYGKTGQQSGEFISPVAVAIAAIGPHYDPSSDHIYVGDRMNHRIVRLNFSFNSSAPESDRIV